MSQFTVLLLAPPAEAAAYGEFYLAHVQAQDRRQAVAIAQMDACEAYGMLRSRADEWPALLVFPGYQRDSADLPPIEVNGKNIQRLNLPT